MKMAFLILGFVSVSLFGFCQDSASKRQMVRQTIDSIFSVYNAQTPGAAVAIIKDGQVVFQKGYGMADLNHNIPVTPQTVFNIASVSKQFTAFAIYLLADEGRISLEDDVRKFIKELPDYGHVIRIKHLLAHTSGLRDQAALGALAGYRPGDISTTAQILNIVARQKALNFQPGTAFGYSNTGYTLLAEIIRRVTGKSFARYTDENIFRPLGMRSTQFYENHNSIVKNKAESYEKINDIYYHKPLNVSNPGPSNLLTSVEDLTKWLLNFENPVVGTPALIKAFNEVSYLDNGTKVILRVFGDGDTAFHAKGQNLSTYKQVPMMTHGGHAAGFRTFMGRFPNQRLGIIVLSNDEHNEQLRARWQLADYFISEHLKEEKGGNPTTPVKTTTATPSFSTTLAAFKGEYYSDELRTSYQVISRGNTLILTHTRLEDVDMTRIGETKFSGSGPETFAFEINFIKEKEVVTGFTISNFGVKDLKFARLDRRENQ